MPQRDRAQYFRDRRSKFKAFAVEVERSKLELFEEKLKEKIGTKVRINRKTEQKGKIEIEYYSPEELEKILAYFK